MPATLRPLTTGQLLDSTFQVYRQNFTLFAGISAVPQVCLLLLQLGLLAIIGRSTSPQNGVIIGAVFALAVLVISVVLSSIATAASTFAVSDVHLEKATSISACFSRVKGKIGRVIYTSLELGLRVGIGFILLIIPGVYWAGKYGLAVPAVVLEDIKAKKSFQRSADLTRGAVGRIIAIYFLTWILIFAIGMTVGVALGAIAPGLTKAAGTVTSKAFEYLISAVVNTVVTPIMSIALTLAYYDQRVRKEAFDIENMMALLGEPGANAADTAIGATS